MCGVMSTKLQQGSILDPILFIKYTLDPHYLLEIPGVTFQFYDLRQTKENLTQVLDAVSY